MSKRSLSEILGGLKDLVTRFEVVDETGRVYVRKGVKVHLSYQDGGTTLKIFVQPRKPNVEGKG